MATAPVGVDVEHWIAEQGRRLGVLMTLPAQLLLLFIVLFPLFMQIYISLTYWSPTDGFDWIYAYRSANWFDNYVSFFTDDELLSSVLRTLGIMAVAVPASSSCSVSDWRFCSSTASRGGASSTRSC